MADMFESGAIPKFERALDVLSARHRVVAHNVANMNTTGYKTKEIAFKDALANIFSNEERLDKFENDGFSHAKVERQILRDLESRVRRHNDSSDPVYNQLMNEVSQLSVDEDSGSSVTDILEAFEVNSDRGLDDFSNDVELDIEMNKLSETSILYQMMLKATTKRLRQVDMAIRESI